MITFLFWGIRIPIQVFLQCVSIAMHSVVLRCSYSKSVRLSVRLSVCLMLVLCQNDLSCDHAVFTVG